MTASAAPRQHGSALATFVGVATLAIGAALGTLWLIEGIVKVRSGFGAADILLVADGAARNSRVPGWFAPLGETMRGIPAVFGFGIPVLELLLGTAFALLAVVAFVGLVRRRRTGIRAPRRIAAVAALVSGGTLALYWASDQLIAQYPAMLVLSLALLAVEALAPGPRAPSAGTASS